MALIKEKRILTSLKDNPNIKGIRILTTSSNFEDRFQGNINHFFKILKNSLQSVDGLTNREFFRNFSGAYFSIDNSVECEIIILYDTSKSNLNELQFKIRLKKMLGSSIKLEFGNFPTFANKLEEMTGIVRRGQLFGDYYTKRRALNQL
jgi:hypothetical protein